MGLGFLSWWRGSRSNCHATHIEAALTPALSRREREKYKKKEKGRSFPDCPFLCCKDSSFEGLERPYSAVADHRCNNASTFCGVALACASTDVLACTRICARVSAAVSVAKSASRMALSLAVTFSSATDRLLMFDSRISFWNAPSLPRKVETCLIALSMMRCAVVRFPLLSELVPPLASVERYPDV